ncbi:hypothetical protein E2C01_064144 [Portunus trituberculatus]|uniref:Uncharacterized protein n=1 Tax=Portunus trituberculatus TaxID=210409 RepID=A0A5B7HAY1_PORTR|nr:hypothetical protein [Portunus trituberculatus]
MDKTRSEVSTATSIKAARLISEQNKKTAQDECILLQSSPQSHRQRSGKFSMTQGKTPLGLPPQDHSGSRYLRTKQVFLKEIHHDNSKSCIYFLTRLIYTFSIHTHAKGFSHFPTHIWYYSTPSRLWLYMSLKEMFWYAQGRKLACTVKRIEV